MNKWCPCCTQELPVSDDVRCDLNDNMIIWKGIGCKVTPHEAEIFHKLLEHEYHWVATERLLLALYGQGREPESGTKCVNIHIFKLRRKLRDADIPIVIENTYQHGYRLRY